MLMQKSALSIRSFWFLWDTCKTRPNGKTPDARAKQKTHSTCNNVNYTFIIWTVCVISVIYVFAIHSDGWRVDVAVTKMKRAEKHFYGWKFRNKYFSIMAQLPSMLVLVLLLTLHRYLFKFRLSGEKTNWRGKYFTHFHLCAEGRSTL